MTTPDIQSLVESVLRLDKEATKGPWDTANEPNGLHQIWAKRVYMLDALVARTCLAPGSKANAEFIALSRTAAPILATEVLRLRAELAEEKRKVEVAITALMAVGHDEACCLRAGDLCSCGAESLAASTIAALTTPSEKGETE